MPCLPLLADEGDQTLLSEDGEALMDLNPGRGRIQDHIIGFELGPYLGTPTQ